MNDIFISYKVHNRKTAIKYYKALKTLDYQVWFDQLVPKGADWKETIAKQIENSNLVICLLSKACLLDDWVLFQIKTAKAHQKEILYILLDDTPWEEHLEYEVSEATYNSLEELPLKKRFGKETMNWEEEASAKERVEETLRTTETLEKVTLFKTEIIKETLINIETVGDVILTKEETEETQETLEVEEIAQDSAVFEESDQDMVVFEETVQESSPTEEVQDRPETENKKEKPINNKKRILKPILNIGLMVIFSALAFLFYGVKILNITLDYRYGCILVGITGILILSYVHKRIVYIIQSLLAVALLCVTIFLVPPYYISSVSINSMVFLLFYFFAFGVRFSKINIWLALLASLFYSVLFTALDSTIVILIDHFLDFDCSWISIIGVVAFIAYKYWSIRNDFK